MHNSMTLTDNGMEVVITPITDVRIHRVDKQWLVEYRRKPQWYFDQWWWFNDGKYVEYRDAAVRAALLVDHGYVTSTKYKTQTYKVKK